VPVYELGIDEHGESFYTMKFVKGITLDEVLRGLRHGRREMLEKYPLGTLLTVFQKICDAVAFAHSKGVVHRDLKPENVMVGEFGAVLVMDWGIARSAARNDERVIAGTRGYMAPEQLRGEAVDGRADIYALGAVLAFLIGSERSRALDAIVARAMASDPNDRYGDARELAEDVLRFLDGEPVSAHRENVFERAARFLTRHRALVAMLLAYLLMRTIILFWARL
ncbi:MAG TPA: serine/threonine-protein kinase, partial [Thermoanaerobaculia bacterium]|nr:serine/threonine-protein kinase [Thermoanaerobaculia bacterium]